MNRGIIFPVFIVLIILGGGIIIADALPSDKSIIARTLQNDNTHRAQQSFNIDAVQDGSQIISTNVLFTLDSNIGDLCVLILNEAHLNKDKISLPFTCGINNIPLEIKGVHALQTKLNTDNFEIIVQSLTTNETIHIVSDQLNLDIIYQPPTYFALIENDIVTNVIVADQSFVDGQNGKWVESDIKNGKLAGVGDVYDSIKNKFISPQPYPSWLLNNTSGTWYNSIPYPTDGLKYLWNETTISWELQ